MNTDPTETREINDLTPPYQPLHDYVLAKLVPQKDSLISAPGIDPRCDLVVVAVGPGRITDQVGPDGQLLLNKPTVKVGDVVMVNPNAQFPIEMKGMHCYILVNHFQIFGVKDPEVVKWMEDHPKEQSMFKKPSNIVGGGSPIIDLSSFSPEKRRRN